MVDCRLFYQGASWLPFGKMEFETMWAWFLLCTQGTYQFMSDDVLTAAEYRSDYLKSPVDGLFSFYHTMQWAAVFHDQEFAAEDIPFDLKILRGNLLGSRSDRLGLLIPTKLLPLHLLGRVNMVHS